MDALEIVETQLIPLVEVGKPCAGLAECAKSICRELRAAREAVEDAVEPTYSPGIDGFNHGLKHVAEAMKGDQKCQMS